LSSRALYVGLLVLPFGLLSSCQKTEPHGDGYYERIQRADILTKALLEALRAGDDAEAGRSYERLCGPLSNGSWIRNAAKDCANMALSVNCDGLLFAVGGGAPPRCFVGLSRSVRAPHTGSREP
jgi:hypothetical protein